MRRQTLSVLALALAAALTHCASPEPSTDELPASSQSPQALTPGGGLRFMTYNIKHGELSSLESIASVIKAQSPDLVALQEVDVLTTRSGEVDQAARLGALTGMYYSFQPSLLDYDTGQYGLALLSRHPIRTSQRIPLRSAAEQRILALMEVQLDATHVIPVGITHFGTTGATERQNQAEDVKAALAGKTWALLGGDLNATPSEAGITSLTQQLTDAWTRGGSGSGYTHDASFPTRRIDYVMLGSSWTSPVQASVVGASSQSDHRPVVATLILPWSQTLFGDRVPANPVEEADTRAVEIGVKFRANVAGTVTALRFYRGTGNASGYVARLWTGGGALLAQVNVTDGRIPGWQEVPLPTPISLTAGATYVASYYSSNGQFARDVSGLASAVVSGNLTAPGSASVGGNGVYVYQTGGGFPASSYKDANYWVDVRFVPAP
jgi:endonuclease/exonuclease/phosphatase family metal-dependent hydrolase